MPRPMPKHSRRKSEWNKGENQGNKQLEAWSGRNGTPNKQSAANRNRHVEMRVEIVAEKENVKHDGQKPD